MSAAAFRRYTGCPMDTSPASLQRLARQLLALEAATGDAAGPPSDAAARVCAKLGVSLTRLAGTDGFASLLRRAISLARKDNPALEAVAMSPDGSLGGLEAVVSDATGGGPEAVVGIVAHLLGLLVAFIGEPLTLRLVRETWPDAASGEQGSET